MTAARTMSDDRAIAAHETVFMKVKNFSRSFFWSCTSATPGMPLIELATTSNLPASLQVHAVGVGEVGLPRPGERGVLVGLLEAVERLVA